MSRKSRARFHRKRHLMRGIASWGAGGKSAKHTPWLLGRIFRGK